MTVLELSNLLNTLPGDMEITVDFCYCNDYGRIIGCYKVLDISPKGKLEIKYLYENSISYDEEYQDQYDKELDYCEEDSMEYFEAMYIANEIEVAWKEFEEFNIFQTAEEKEGYIEYQNTLYQQDRDLEELVTKAHKTAEEKLINTINNELDNLLCKN